VGLEKAKALARARGVEIATEVADLRNYQPPERHFGSVVSVFAHLPSFVREKLCPLLERALKPHGLLLLEAYSENQLARNTGGPKNLDMLMSIEKLRKAFPTLRPLLLREVEREVLEGEGHTGMASVVQFIARNGG